jgi:nicotinamidase/pyrazinamidase
VDVQPDFLPGGDLPVPHGDEILRGVASLMDSGGFGVVVATQDWHPPDHVSFASQHEDREPMDTIELYGHEQILWPDHCVQGTRGAELHPDLPWNQVDAIIRKATDPEVDSYSAFRDNWSPDGDRPATGLAGMLRERGLERVVICGLARDVCVRWTAEDAAGEGFDTTVVWDLTRAVEPERDPEVRETLTRRGVHLIGRDQV